MIVLEPDAVPDVGLVITMSPLLEREKSKTELGSLIIKLYVVVLVRPPPVPVTVTGNVPNEAEELTIKVLIFL